MPKDKSGKKISWGEFFIRWGKGIKNVAKNPTPMERLTIESRAAVINLTGMWVCLFALIIFRDAFFVSWFAYGLMLIFSANIVTTGMKYFGLKEQKKFLKNLESEKGGVEDD